MQSRAYGLQSYAMLDLGDSAGAFRTAVAMKSCAEKVNHAELIAWALGTQTLILSFDNQYKPALPLINEGLQLPISGMARSRLHCRAVMCWSELGDLQNTISSIRESEKTIDISPGSPDEADGIFYFSRAKHHYYAGTGLLEFSIDQARQAEKETRQAITMFAEGNEDTKSISDELLSYIYLAESIFKQGRIDEILDTINPVLTAAREFRTSWHLRNLRSLGASLKASERFRDSEITAKIFNAIQDFEKSLDT
jgi:tetratricopeptide (TPR) repeat protein